MLKRKYRGRVLRYGDNINTDEIIPCRFSGDSLEGESAKDNANKYAMIFLDPDFTKKVQEGDILVLGENAGCGSSRENAATVLKDCGVAAIVAKSFANIFYRNAINNAFPLIVCNNIKKIQDGDEIEIDLNKNIIINITTKNTIETEPIPEIVLNIMNQGGLINYTKKLMKSDFS